MDGPKWMLLACLVAAGHVEAAEVYRCVAKNGDVAIVSRPCAANQKTTWVKDGSPDVHSPEAWDALQREQRRRQVDAARLSRAAGTDGSRVYDGDGGGSTQSQRRQSRCDAAKARRQAMLDAFRNSPPYELRRQLNDEVFDACK